MQALNSYHIELFGIIQGVGFRPFVYHLAHKMQLKGYVQNCYENLLIYLTDISTQQLEDFLSTLFSTLPPHAHITHHHIKPALPLMLDTFEIRASKATKQAHLSPTLLPLDMRICPDCLKDMQTQGRFYNYAFTTCTHCGARYSIIDALPYDRIHTSMRDFAMCEACQSDYANPHNRRFHTQPISCLQCAIRLRFIDERGKVRTFKHAKDDIKLIDMISAKLNEGKIIAIKGVGGFNFVASANNKQAITTLRARKNRPHKPFALMFKNLADIKSLAFVNKKEQAALCSHQAPIVILQRHFKPSELIDEECLALIAPDISTIGAILPYNGIMHLLFMRMQTPLIFTSANISGEPIITQCDELLHSGVQDVILDYNREILHPLDDSIMRYMAGEMRLLRLARGFAPLCLPLENKQKHFILGVGAQQKSTLSLLDKDNKVLVSPYLGDLQGVDSINVYQSQMAFLQHLYAQAFDSIIYDLHPKYASTQIALKTPATSHIALSHHKAHFYAILGECNALDSIHAKLGIIWDGTGFGEEGHIWGGEGFLYQNNAMHRIYHFETFVFLGGEGAIKDIGKLAASLLWQYQVPNTKDILHFSPTEIALLQSAHKSGIYPLTSSLGRIIDAVAYILGILKEQSYEGQSGALLETYAMAYKRPAKPYKFRITNGVVDMSDVIHSVCKERKNPKKSAYRFLNTLAHIALAMAQMQRLAHKDVAVYFSGGVFQNKFVCDRIRTLFSRHHITFFMHKKLPCNDTNISFGQVVFGSQLGLKLRRKYAN
ncbi:carbamoyltransferase HypF [Helicobacter jaachi]|uniref:Carbamoyltransferase n=2 Tax=Helicobacter jaachi TaxID=1677920 RepID=A0A4U8TB79_9HELI|nr:carbamoyltransferase HypF [Helicobacter jaachi]